MRAADHRPTLALALVALVALVALTVGGALGCGHPATRSECEEIIEISARLELKDQKVTDEKQIAERLAAVRAAKGEQLLRSCEGRRITASAMDCVRRAQSATEVDCCFQ